MTRSRSASCQPGAIFIVVGRRDQAAKSMRWLGAGQRAPNTFELKTGQKTTVAGGALQQGRRDLNNRPISAKGILNKGYLLDPTTVADHSFDLEKIKKGEQKNELGKWKRATQVVIEPKKKKPNDLAAAASSGAALPPLLILSPQSPFILNFQGPSCLESRKGSVFFLGAEGRNTEDKKPGALLQK